MLKLFLNYIHEYCDAPRPWGLYFQDSAAPQMEGLVELHDNIMFYLIIILFGVGWIITSVIRNYAISRSPISHKYLNHGTDVPVHNNSNSISLSLPPLLFLPIYFVFSRKRWLPLYQSSKLALAASAYLLKSESFL